MLKGCLGRVGSSPSLVPYIPACIVSRLSSPGTTGNMKGFAPTPRAGLASMVTLHHPYLAMSLRRLQPVPKISLSLGSWELDKALEVLMGSGGMGWPWLSTG